MSQVHSQKEKIRGDILSKRLNLSGQEVHRLSEQIQNRVVKSSFWVKSERLALYSPVKNEVETTFLFMKALEEGKTVYFPRVEQGIQFYEVRDPNELVKGAWGILEPKDECVPLAQDEGLDLLIVPGIAFDRLGHRLGYGRGFYDRVLERFKEITMAIAYEFQVVDELPTDPWDRQVSRIMTEKNEYVVARDSSLE